MCTTPTLILVLLVFHEPSLRIHVDAMYRGSGFDEREIETIAVVGRHDGWSGISDVLKPSANEGGLRREHIRLGYETHGSEPTSSGSLKTVNSPSYSSFGVYSKSSISSLTISLLVIKYPCPSIIYDIIMI
jgi:hypothetical protein